MEERDKYIRRMLGYSEYLNEDKPNRVPWFKLMTYGLVGWAVFVAIIMTIQNV